MNFRSYTNLAGTIANSRTLTRLDFDLVVSIPRSGVVPAAMIALNRNCQLTDVDSYVRGNILSHGGRRDVPNSSFRARDFTRPLIVDDSVDSGRSMAEVRRKLSGLDCSPIYLAIYAHKKSVTHVDEFLEIVPTPRSFEWNMWHSKLCDRACFDIDGVLCPDPTPAENDDGAAYERFMRSTPSLVRPTRPLAYLVTSRLEKYRSITEEWLSSHGIGYKQLVMLDVASAVERRRLGIHASFKSDVYRNVEARLFVESDPSQAEKIARTSGKPVLDYAAKAMARPGSFNVARANWEARSLGRRAVSRLQRTLLKARP